MRVLVVDDDTAVRDSLARTLRFEGHQVDTAGDGQQALDAVRADEPDAMILDVSMPRLDGLETCRQLRAEGRLLPVLMVTARDSVGDRVAGLDAGADDYLVKPFALQELQARLRALLSAVWVSCCARNPVTPAVWWRRRTLHARLSLLVTGAVAAAVVILAVGAVPVTGGGAVQVAVDEGPDRRTLANFGLLLAAGCVAGRRRDAGRRGRGAAAGLPARRRGGRGRRLRRPRPGRRTAAQRRLAGRRARRAPPGSGRPG
jgi:CheY-like chemotaxis protein